jgi:gliding motility-associated-like protein
LEHNVFFADSSADSSIVNWLWDFGDGDFEEVQHADHTFHSEEIFEVILTVENEHGCLDYDTVSIQVIQVIDIPDVFTPNGDGYNDQLLVENSGVTAYEWTVYNRWGIIMHYDKTGGIFWDGLTPAGVEAESGTYFYILKVENEFSEGSFEKTGTVTLIR